MKKIEEFHAMSNADGDFDGQKLFLSVKQRFIGLQNPFLDTLVAVAGGHGWSGGIFTGAHLCAVATYALCDGLNGKTDPSFTPIARGMDIFMNTEYRGGVGFYKEAFGFHSILEIVHPDAGSMYVDAVYGQLDGSWAGKFLIFEQDSLGVHYSTSKDVGERWKISPWRSPSSKRALAAGDMYDITPQKDMQLQYFEEALGVTKADYARLVKSAEGNI